MSCRISQQFLVQRRKQALSLAYPPPVKPGTGLQSSARDKAGRRLSCRAPFWETKTPPDTAGRDDLRSRLRFMCRKNLHFATKCRENGQPGLASAHRNAGRAASTDGQGQVAAALLQKKKEEASASSNPIARRVREPQARLVGDEPGRRRVAGRAPANLSVAR